MSQAMREVAYDTALREIGPDALESLKSKVRAEIEARREMYPE
jgi:hypothetical protein